MSTRKTDRRARPRRLEYLVIESVTPELDGGRHPIKRIVGDIVHVGADIISNGPDRVSARVLYRSADEEDWSAVSMSYDEDADRWSGSFVADRVGRWFFTIEASTDRFATWRSDLQSKVVADRDVTVELMEGAQLARSASRSARSAAARASLLMTAKALEDRRDTSNEKRVQRALDDDFLALMRDHLRSAHVTRFRELPVVVDRARAQSGSWYQFFPRSHGTFADASAQLPRIANLGFDVVYLPPIHPIGVTGRKGKDGAIEADSGDVGSPWAVGNQHGGHTAVDPALGDLADFDRFVRDAEAQGMEIALDYALQCSPDHPWVREHPDWFHVRPDRSIKYAGHATDASQDAHALNFWCDDRDGLWYACRDIVLFWVGHGVKIFVADNAHAKPAAFWEWLIQDVQHVHPDVIFVAGAFDRPKRIESLAKLGFTMSYTYFLWKTSAASIEAYFTDLVRAPLAEFYRGILFPSTVDILNEYLIHGGRPAFRARLLLAATLLPSYGVYSGFELCENAPVRAGAEEHLHSEKYERRTRDYDAAGNINDDVRRLNEVRRACPALRAYTNLAFHPSDNPAVLFYRKSGGELGGDVLVVVNTDPFRTHESVVHVPIHQMGIGTDQPYTVHDLLTGTRFTWRGSHNYVRLDPTDQPGHVLLVERGASPSLTETPGQ